MDTLNRQFVYMAMMEDTLYQVKIGHSGNPMVREKHLFGPGVSAPYHMLYVWEVQDMVYVEKQVLQPELKPFQVFSGKEIYNLDWMYPNSIDPTYPDIVNGLTLANMLSKQIEELLTRRQIAFRPWYIYDCEQYNYLLQEQKAQSAPINY